MREDRAEGRYDGQPEKQCSISGIYYYNIDDPIVDGSFNTDSSTGIISSQKLKGPSNNELMQLAGHDAMLAGDDGKPRAGYSSDIVAASYNKDGQFGRSSKVLSKEQFDAISSFVEGRMHEEAGRILSGDIAIDPYKQGKQSACGYCPYRSVCAFDPKQGSRYRILGKTDEDRIWEEMNKYRNNRGSV